MATAAVATVTDQALVAVAASHVSFAGTVATDLIAGSFPEGPTRVAVASWTHTHTDEPLSCGPGAAGSSRLFRTFAAQRVAGAQPVEALHAAVAACPSDVRFAATLASNHARPHVGVAVTQTLLQRPRRVAVAGLTGTERRSEFTVCTCSPAAACTREKLTDAHVLVPDVPAGVLVVEGFTQLTVAARGVMRAVVTHASAGVSRC